MTTELTIDDLLRMYARSKQENGGDPLNYRQFLEKSKLNKMDMIRVLGPEAYTKLQGMAGDEANAFTQPKTSLDVIMHSYGGLALNVLSQEGRLPTASHWAYKKLRPTESGLAKSHGIRWSEFPVNFLSWCGSNLQEGGRYDAVCAFIRSNPGLATENKPRVRLTADQTQFQAVCEVIEKWSPALRRNSEEAYKSELSHHLKEVHSRDWREERTSSLCDIALGESIGVELKKSPDLSEYDRCFGQTARHLDNFAFVAVVIFDVSKQDPFDDFCKLVDLFFKDRVRVIKM